MTAIGPWRRALLNCLRNPSLQNPLCVDFGTESPFWMNFHMSSGVNRLRICKYNIRKVSIRESPGVITDLPACQPFPTVQNSSKLKAAWSFLALSVFVSWCNPVSPAYFNIFGRGSTLNERKLQRRMAALSSSQWHCVDPKWIAVRINHS